MRSYHRLAAVVVLAAAAAACGARAAQNALENPSFETGGAEKAPAAWKSHVYAGKAQLRRDAVGKTGGHSAMIASQDGADAAWQIRAKVLPDSLYRLSGWIRTEDLKATTGRGAQLNVHEIGSARTPAVTGSRDWTEVSCEFQTGSQTDLLVNCLYGGWGQATGKAWFDDVRLELILQGDREHPSAVVDLGRKLGPISPYIYGQFIEHLGRCIYGGIWAEMLEDRKFYNLVASRQSPWQRLGGEVGWSLTMDPEKPFVGAWSVKITATDRAPDEPHGIIQSGLGVLAGKEYVGHVVLAGEAQVEVALAWGPEDNQRQRVALRPAGQPFKAYPVRFRAGATTEDASLAIGVRPVGSAWIGTASLMPADNVRGMRADTLELLKELNAPIYRWPGGNFVSGYDWRDGIGPRDRRPPRKNPAWRGVEHNDFGIDEFVAFCREVKAEPLVVVNTGLGSPELAAGLVAYCNSGPETPWGKRRAANGHEQPYHVRWWGVGNEMYGGWQLGHIALEQYTTRHNEFARAMRQVDAEVKLVAVGASGKWSQQMLADCHQSMDLLSEHFYCGEKKDLEAHVAQIPDSVRGKALAHRGYLQAMEPLRQRPIAIALDEWNYWYGKHLYGELGTRYFLKDALGIARGIHEMVRHRDVFQMANYAQTVNVIGCIKTTKTAAAFATTGLPLALYRRHFGTTAVDVKGIATPLDVAAALTDDGARATIAVVNPTLKAGTLKLQVRGGRLARQAARYLITGGDPMAYNEPGKPPAVKITDSRVSDFDPAAVEVPPLSIVLYVVGVEGE
jgi:alpha-N-arabinofuranosidase